MNNLAAWCGGLLLAASTNARGKTPLTLAVERGQRRDIATSYDPGDRQSTASLLRKLGATQ